MITRLAWLTTAAARGRDRAVLRSTWDYPERLDAFLDRLTVIDGATELVNPVAVVRWNLDKRYLTELAAAGVPTVPTTAVEPGSAPSWPGGEFVVKPAVGAGSRDVARYGPDDGPVAAEHVRRLHGRGVTALVQPFLHAVERDGEWPLVFLGGTFSHAAGKRVTLPHGRSVDGLFAREDNRAFTADAEQVDVARAALDVATDRFGPVPYARVDLVGTGDGGLAVLELELIEPSLFLREGGPAAADRLASALAAI